MTNNVIMDASGRKIYDDEASFLTWALSSQATELAFPVYGLARDESSCSRADKTHRKHFWATGEALFSGSFFRLRDGYYWRDSFSETVVNICLTNRFQFHSHFGVFVAKTADFGPDGISVSLFSHSYGSATMMVWFFSLMRLSIDFSFLSW